MTCRPLRRRRPSRTSTKPTEIAGLGLKLAPISPELREKYQLNADQKGVVVTDVAPNGAAAAARTEAWGRDRRGAAG